MTKPPVDPGGSAIVETLRLTNIADRPETGEGMPRDGSGSYLIRTMGRKLIARQASGNHHRAFCRWADRHSGPGTSRECPTNNGMQADIQHIKQQQHLANTDFRIMELGGSMSKIDRIRRLRSAQPFAMSISISMFDLLLA
jgi:hypothetical protein